MSEPLVVVGAGGFGRETLDVVSAINSSRSQAAFEVLGVLDDAPSATALSRLSHVGVRHLGGVGDWLAGDVAARFVIAIGAPATRTAIARLFEEHGHRAVTLIHPSAIIGSATTIDDGSVVCGGAQVSTGVSIGRHVHVNPNATIGHDAVLRDGVSINPGAIISGDVTIEGPGTLVGAGAVILQGLTVGAGSLVGAAACVVRDVPTGATVKGVPAR